MRNLTEVSLKNRTLVWYFIIITAIGGILSYFQLGRMEDPQFTIRQMVVTAAWPGATAEEMQEQVTDKLEKRLQDTPHLKAIKSENRPGQTVIYVELDDTIDKAAATFTYGSGEGFSVNGTVEVLPADDPDYPNKMYFHSDDVDAFPRYMYDNRGDAYRAKYIIENSSDVYMLLDKDNPPQETSFAVSVTVDSVTVRYSADGHAYDTIHVKAASNR